MKHMAIILISILILPFLTQAAEITDGLILYMPLDEGSGNTTEDKSKTKAEGEVKGANGLMASLAKHYSSNLLPSMFWSPTIKPSISRVKLLRLPGSGSSVFQVHMPSYSAQGKVEVDVILVLVTG